MLTKKQIAEKYFNGMGSKHLMEFKTTTPGKNKIEGYICKKHNYFLGSLFITFVNGKETGQFVQGFPKIHYPEPKNKYYTYEVDSASLPLYEKLDGSNIVFYELKNELGNVIEIIPKSRGLPVADSKLRHMLKMVDTSIINYLFKEFNAASIAVELFGVRNQHEIYYYKTYLDIALLGIYNNEGDWIEPKQLDKLKNLITRPQLFFTIHKTNDGYMLEVNGEVWRFHKHYPKWSEENHKTYSKAETIYEVFNAAKAFMQYVNEEYFKEQKHIFTEGAVALGFNEELHDFYTKIKPKDIEEKHRQSDRVPVKSIRKEVYKYFDEYGDQVREIYLENKNHYFDYIVDQLKEEYTDEQINKSAKKIESVFFDYWNDISIPESLQKICEQIVMDNPGCETGQLMSIFARHHPEKKKMAKDIFKHMDAINHRLGNK